MFEYNPVPERLSKEGVKQLTKIDALIIRNRLYSDDVSRSRKMIPEYSPDKFAMDSALGQLILLGIMITVLVLVIK